MKPAPFSYCAPTTIEETVRLLTSVEDPKILAGGQSLVPAMNFRLARPATLIDINHVTDLSHLSTVDGEIRIGALTRHRRFEKDEIGGPLGELMAQMASKVGHMPIRVRGTFGGSLAHADPAAEWCLLMVALGGSIVAMGANGERTIDAQAFFRSVFTTDLRTDELLTEARIPLLGSSHQVGFAAFSRRAGDFALVMALVALTMADGVVNEARIGIGGVAETPLRALEAESELVGTSLGIQDIERAATVASGSIATLGDIHASAEYRSDLVGVMTRRALTQAAQTGGLSQSARGEPT